MAVILDIPMPGGCGKCPLNDDNWGCIVTGKPVQEDCRPETCPLHEINPVEKREVKQNGRDWIKAMEIQDLPLL